MLFSSSSSEKRGKEVLKNLYYFSENQMLDCNQYCIIDHETDEIALFDPGNSLSLKSLLELNPEPIVEINSIDAKARDIFDDDMVTVFNKRARTTLKARISESVGPGVVNITEGWWIEQFKEGSVNHLTHDIVNPVQNKVYEPNMHMNDVAVEIIKYKEGGK